MRVFKSTVEWYRVKDSEEHGGWHVQVQVILELNGEIMPEGEKFAGRTSSITRPNNEEAMNMAMNVVERFPHPSIDLTTIDETYMIFRRVIDKDQE